jgi:flagellin-specific chaperone FliS
MIQELLNKKESTKALEKLIEMIQELKEKVKKNYGKSKKSEEAQSLYSQTIELLKNKDLTKALEKISEVNGLINSSIVPTSNKRNYI